MNLNSKIHIDAKIAAFFALAIKHASSLNLLCSMAVVLLVSLSPELGFAQSSGGSLSASATTAVNYIKTGVYFILIVAVLGSAVAAAFGRMEWATVGRVLIGCVVAGMATEVVDGLSNLKGQ